MCILVRTGGFLSAAELQVSKVLASFGPAQGGVPGLLASFDSEKLDRLSEKGAALRKAKPEQLTGSPFQMSLITVELQIISSQNSLQPAHESID